MGKKAQKPWRKGPVPFSSVFGPFWKVFSSIFYKKKVFEHFLIDILCLSLHFNVEPNYRNYVSMIFKCNFLQLSINEAAKKILFLVAGPLSAAEGLSRYGK